MIIGLDDTDSLKAGCTSYLGVLIYEQLLRYGDPLDFPHLIRLNPNIPYKTRGNGAISIWIQEHVDPDQIQDLVIQLVAQHSQLEDENTHPGVVFLERITPQISRFALSCLHRMMDLKSAKKLIQRSGGRYHGFKKSRGIIGALAAAGMPLEQFSYELMWYRYPEAWGTPRQIQPESVMAADLESFPYTWDNYDWFNSRSRVAPNSPCPVLLGIRGSSLESILRAASLIRSEPSYRWMIFRTNQASDAHLQWAPSKLSQYGCYAVQGKLLEAPFQIRGGHLFLELMLPGGSKLKCVAFEPTKQFRKFLRELVPGDEVIGYGSMMDGKLNLEKLELVRTVKLESNPVCSSCNRSMESMGKDKGFRCRKCGAKAFIKRALPRRIWAGIYEVAVSARRHLSQPLIIHPSWDKAWISR